MSRPYITLHVPFGVEDVAHQLSQEEAFDFIKNVDLAMADYDFTKRCMDHFVAEIAKEDAVAAR